MANLNSMQHGYTQHQHPAVAETNMEDVHNFSHATKEVSDSLNFSYPPPVLFYRKRGKKQDRIFNQKDLKPFDCANEAYIYWRTRRNCRVGKELQFTF